MDSLHTVLIQIADDMLLLPNAAIAEVASMERFEPPEPGAPPWLAGWHAMAERRIPVLSVEALAGGGRPEISRRARIVIVYPLSTRVHGGSYAILAQGQPHLVNLARDAISLAPTPPQARDGLLLSRVQIASQNAAIPDLEALEARLAELV